MPRWKPLPDELDPQIREFTYQLRGLVDRSGMSVATIADRTGYSKSSWERYLGGRLLPPRGAAHALGRVTGMDIRHLETMWELAERAWSREEMRHDQTMNAVLVAQAREALGEFWDQERAKGRKWGRKGAGAKSAENKSAGHKAAAQGRGADADADSAREKPEEDWKERTGEHEIIALPADSFAPPSTSDLSEHTTVLRPIRTGGPGSRPGHRNGSGGGDRNGAGGRGGDGDRNGAGPGSRNGSVPGQPPGAGLWGVDAADESPRTVQMRPVAAASPSEARSARPSTSGPKPGSAPPAYPSSDGRRPAPGAEPDADHLNPPVPERSSRGRLVASLLGGMLSVFALLGAGVWFFGLPGAASDGKALPKPPPSTRPDDLPAGVKCQGESCSGKDPERMGCGGTNVKSSASQFVGPSMVEVRYSALCKAAWGRITGAAQGDTLKITAGGGQFESDKVGSTNDAYTEMVSVDSATEARACATLTVGRTGCTKATTTR